MIFRSVGAGRFVLSFLCLVVFFQGIGLLLWGGESDWRERQYVTRHWDMTKGLPSNTIISIAQTGDGYLWVSTAKGLVRFDGVSFSSIPFSRPEKGTQALKNASAGHLLVDDRKKILYIPGRGGLTLYHYETGETRTFSKADGLSANRLRKVGRDSFGNIWISFFHGGVNRITDGKLNPFDDAHHLTSDKINAIFEDAKGNLFFGGREKGVFRHKSGTFSPYPIKELEGRLLIDMLEDRSGNLWFCTSKGVLRKSGDSVDVYMKTDGLPDNYVTCILEDPGVGIWVGTNKGLCLVWNQGDRTSRFTPRFTPRFAPRFKNFLESFTVTSLFKDKEGNIWAGTYKSGLKQLKPSTFLFYCPSVAYREEDIISVYREPGGDTWCGTFSGKLLRSRDGRHLETVEPEETAGFGIQSIGGDKLGRLWFGTTGAGVFKMPVGGAPAFTTAQGLADNSVTAIFADSRGNLWFGTNDGVSKLRVDTGKLDTCKDADGLAGKKVHNIYEDGMGNIWIAADKGITRLEGGLFEGGNIKRFLSGISVTGIYSQAFGRGKSISEGVFFWVATDGAGLKRLTVEDGSIVGYTVEKGLASNKVYQLFEDAYEDFWIMSDSGVLRVARAELNRLAGGKINRIHCVSYGRFDGLRSIEFNNYTTGNSVMRNGNGELWFLSKKGIGVVNPEGVRINKKAPEVVLEELVFDGTPVGLNWKARDLRFRGVKAFGVRFTALTFRNPEKIWFKYCLEGVDGDWKYLPVGGKREVSYSGLEPGRYTFKVSACNEEGIWDYSGAAATFVLEPYFYQVFFLKVGFPVLVVLVLVVVVYTARKRGSRRLEGGVEAKGDGVDGGAQRSGERELKEERVEEELPGGKGLEEVRAKGDEAGKMERAELGVKGKYRGFHLEEDYVEECVKRLMHLVEVKKVYRDSELTLETLAEGLKVQRHVLSRILNERLKRSFSDFINYYRIEEAKRIFANPRNAKKKNTVVSDDVGFKTSAVFYKAFRKFTGKTPKEYRKEVGERD